MNKALEAEGSDKRVEVVVRESPAKGFDDDALQLLKVFGIGGGRTCSSPRTNGSAPSDRRASCSNSTTTSPSIPSISSIFPTLGGGEVPRRVPGYRRTPRRGCSSMTKLLRQAGYDDAFIEAMPERTMSGDLTMDDVIDIAKQVVDKTDAQYGILHRPNKGPDYIMVFQAYGNDLVRSRQRQPSPRA